MTTPKVERRKCANHHCHRHVHGNAAKLGGRHCSVCIRQFRYAFRATAERAVGVEVGRELSRFFVPRESTPNNLGDQP